MTKSAPQRGAHWRAAHRLLMERAPEMGIALLNSDGATDDLCFRSGLWEVGPARRSTIADRISSMVTRFKPGAQVRVIRGFGLGYWYLHSKSWLSADPARRLILSDTSVAACDRLLCMPWAQPLLNDAQVLVLARPGEQQRDLLAREIAWSSLLLSLDFARDEFARESEGDGFGDFCGRVRGHFDHFDQMARELLQFSHPFYANFYRNFLRQPEVATADALAGAFSDLPVLICGAGPSLAGQAEDIAKLRRRALILAGGSGVNALAALEIVPHFGLGIDPNAAQEQRIRSHTLYDLPYLFRRRIFAESLAAICGPVILIRGAAGHPLAEWLDAGRDVEIEEGQNVIHLALDLARFFQSPAIALCGMDLAYRGERGYSEGVLNGHIGVGVEERTACCQEEIVLWPNDRGERVPTHWKWVKEARWIGEFAARHPQLQLVNAAPGGLGIEGVERRSLGWVLANCSAPERDLSNRVWLEMQRAAAQSPRRSRAEQRAAMKPFWQSLKSCEAHLKRIAQLLAAKQQWNAASLAIAQEFALLENELAYDLALRFPDQMHKVILERDRSVISRSGSFEPRLEALLALRRCRHLKRGCRSQREEWRAASAECPPQSRSQTIRTIPVPKSRYSFEGSRLVIAEPKLGIALDRAASSARLPTTWRQSKQGDATPTGHQVALTSSSSGVLREIWLERDGQRDGQALMLDENGAISGEAYYCRGQLHGPSRYYLANGQLTSSAWFVDGARWGIQVQHYHSGPLYSCGGYWNERPHGLHKTHFENGDLKARLRYERGQLVGTAKLYHSSGHLARSTTFANGQRAGWDRQWYASGARAFAAHYSEGTPDGTARRWHGNGQLAERIRYLERGGRAETAQFSPRGQRVSEGIYLDSMRYRLRTWDSRGAVSEEIWYWHEGRLVASDPSSEVG